MKLRMDSYLALTVETGENLARKNEVGALEKTKLVRSKISHQRADAIARGLGSSQRPKPALASCRTVDAPLGESARQNYEETRAAGLQLGTNRSATKFLRLDIRRKQRRILRHSTTGSCLAEMQEVLKDRKYLGVKKMSGKCNREM
jgi:hypothetical protein